LPAYGGGALPLSGNSRRSRDKERDEEQREGQLEEEKEEDKKEKIYRRADARLRSLIGTNDHMYDAMENFLLGDPERQISQLGGADSMVAKGDEAKSKGAYLFARSSFEIAAKLEIYQRNRENAKKYLLLAQEVTQKEDLEHIEILNTLLANMEMVMRIAREYYGILAHIDEEKLLP